MPNEKIKFSSEDARVLKQVLRVEKLGANGARLILASPVFDLLTAMGDPVNFAVSLLNSDWDGMAAGAKNIQKIAACSAQAIVILHIEDGAPPPQGDARAYFEHLNRQLDARCQA